MDSQVNCGPGLSHRRPHVVAMLITCWIAGCARAATSEVNSSTNKASGTVDFHVSCSPQAQAEFNQAVALLHHMTYLPARTAFERVVNIDPRCAMAHWGIAMTLFQPLWPTRPSPEELRRGWEEVRTAQALNPPTEREGLFVAATEAFFQEPASRDYWERIRRWKQAMEKVYAACPGDPEATAFYALAILATTPPEQISSTNAEHAAGLLLGILKQNPAHPGAMHYLVHANDVRGREHEDFDVICGYEKVAPRNPHALHMPTHIYTRLGDWDRVIGGNLLAAKAALEFPAGDQGQFVWDEFPHAIEYLVYAYLQKGADDRAREQVNRLQETKPLEPTFKTAFHLASTQTRYALERRAWNEAVNLRMLESETLDWAKFPWPQAVTWFARGLGATHQGQLAEARQATQRLGELEHAAEQTGEVLFTRNIRVLRLELQAWLSQAERDTSSSIAKMREAASLEESTPKHAVTPAPTLPAYELLGDLLLEQHRAAEALAAYNRSLELYPNRLNSLLGAARAAEGIANPAVARSFYRQVLNLAADSNRQSVTEEAQAALMDRK